MTSLQYPSETLRLTQAVKACAAALGFDACGIAAASAVDEQAREQYAGWLRRGEQGCMAWAERHTELRDNPDGLLPGARSVVMVAMNYLPSRLQSRDAPQFARYAYGNDYHSVLRRKLKELSRTLAQASPQAKCRVCVDSAPLRERYWARQAGLGFVGRNNQLILPGKGSFFFLGAMLTTAELVPDEPCRMECDGCMRCVAACPTGALNGDGPVDARRCLSCLTIECRDEELPQWVGKAIGRRVMGCDECQKCCPHNRGAKHTTHSEFEPSDEFLGLTFEDLLTLTPERFERLFAAGPVKRAGLEALKRNARLCIENFKEQPPKAIGNRQ